MTAAVWPMPVVAIVRDKANDTKDHFATDEMALGIGLSLEAPD
jgi:hypothetical protein